MPVGYEPNPANHQLTQSSLSKLGELELESSLSKLADTLTIPASLWVLMGCPQPLHFLFILPAPLSRLSSGAIISGKLSLTTMAWVRGPPWLHNSLCFSLMLDEE